MRNSKLKHSKIRNTGLLFEFLLRQITADVLNKMDNSKASHMIKKRFNERTELGKELAIAAKRLGCFLRQNYNGIIMDTYDIGAMLMRQ